MKATCNNCCRFAMHAKEFLSGPDQGGAGAPLPLHTFAPDSGPIDISARAEQKKEGGGIGGSSSCVISLDAPVEGACVPCGHMAGCMSCLNEIKAKKWGCPVCRAKIDQVIRLYAV
ncbi:hypothetical protein LguiB_014142 [Lonicera macranthoides]